MSRVLVLVEGETEETFVNQVLARHFAQRGLSLTARLMGNSRQRANRGGIRPWPGVRDELVRLLRGDQGLIVTTMVDFYGLPRSPVERAWPGRADAASLQFSLKAAAVQEGMLAEIASQMGSSFDPIRFIPFVIMHEFEALLFSDCEAFARGLCVPGLEVALRAEHAGFASPEEINDSPETAPSKRVLRLLPGYQKPLYGNLAALEIGLETIRSSCKHFDGWLARLEALCRG